MNKQFERIRLRILATLAILSITLCVVSTLLWPISYATGVQLSVRNGAGTRYAVATVPGSIGLIVVRGEPRGSVSLNGCAKGFGATPASATDPLRWFWTRPDTRFGFGTSEGAATLRYEEINNPMTASYKGWFMPIWLFALLTFIGPTWWYLARRRREYRLENGLCMYCGTDMTASPYRCPACGKEPPW
jgi:hypothetical protein